MNKKSDFYYGRKIESISIGTCDGLADKLTIEHLRYYNHNSLERNYSLVAL